MRLRQFAAVAVALSTASAAHGYVRSRTGGMPGTPIFWPGSCVFMQPDSAGTPDLPSDQVFMIIQKSMSNWTSGDAPCSFLQLKYDQPAPLDAHYDGINVVKFRTDKWCHPNDAQSHDVCYDATAAAITTVYFIDKAGDPQNAHIVDADIQLNDINFTFVVVVPGQPLPTARMGTSIADLENTLTHELGHVQGLDHTCKDAATPANEVDDTGNPPPPCNMIPIDEFAKITTATMYNVAMPGEIRKRTPKPDDIAGICNAYPIADDPRSCVHTQLTHGCDYGDGARGPIATALALACLALVVRAARKWKRRAL